MPDHVLCVLQLLLGALLQARFGTVGEFPQTPVLELRRWQSEARDEPHPGEKGLKGISTIRPRDASTLGRSRCSLNARSDTLALLLVDCVALDPQQGVEHAGLAESARAGVGAPSPAVAAAVCGVLIDAVAARANDEAFNGHRILVSPIVIRSQPPRRRAAGISNVLDSEWVRHRGERGVASNSRSFARARRYISRTSSRTKRGERRGRGRIRSAQYARSVRLTNEFEIDAPLETVWAILTDVQLVTPCIPRARLLEMIDETAFRVAVAVRVGLLTIDYVVAVKIEEIDEVARTGRFRIVGEELLGVGVVSAIVWGRLRTAGGRTRVSFEADANIGGIIALVGRPVIELVVGQKLRKLAANVGRLADEFALGLLDFP